MNRRVWFFFIICLAFLLGSAATASAQDSSAAQAIAIQGQAQSQTVIPVFNNTANANAQQQQGQSQGQTQGQSQSNQLSGNQSQVSFGPSTSTSTNINPRQFPIPGNAPFAYLPSYFGPATADVNWSSIKTLDHYKLEWTSGDAEALLHGTHGWFGRSQVKSKPKCFVGTMSEQPTVSYLKVAINGDAKKVKGLTLIGTDDVWADCVNITTHEVLGQAIMDGLRMGADVCLITGEGAAVVLKAFGWGVGISNSVSVVTGMTGNVGNATAGGIGVSGVDAGYRSKPWLQCLFFKGQMAAPAITPPPAAAPAPAVKEVPKEVKGPAEEKHEKGFKVWRKTTM
jgi:hypothetical protein